MLLTPPDAPPTIHVTKIPDWLSIKPISGVYRFFKGERRVLRRRKKIKPSEWVEKHRIITHGPMEGSRMRLSVTPHLAGQLDASFFPSVKTITVCAAAQTAKSTMVDSCIAYVMDRAPGPALSVYPDKLTAQENCEERIKKMINNSPRLSKLKTGSKDDMTNTKIKLLSMIYYLGWAGSAISLSNKSIRYLDLQEVDKYKDAPNKKESGTIELAELRVRSYPHDHKIWITSSPTVEKGAVWQALTVESEIIFEYWVRCPCCHKLQVMKFSQIRWPKDSEGNSLAWQEINNKKLAWYECEHCAEPWDDNRRSKALATRMWRAKTKDGSQGKELFKYLREHRPARIGFHQPSWISCFVSLSEVAADFLKTEDLRKTKVERKKALKNFTNKHCAEPWLDYEVNREENVILALKDVRPAGLVPGDGQVAALTAGVDTQDDGWFYEIRAWGHGLTAESWQIRHGFVETAEALERVLFYQYQDQAGLYYPVHLAVMDAMGHRTDDAYNFCRRHVGRLQAYKGANGRRANPQTWTTIDVYPGSRQIIPGGIRLLTADSNHYKDLLSSRLSILYGDPGAWNYHSETTVDFARQMCAEYLDDKTNLWKCPKNKANHYWDCSVLSLIAAEILQIKFWPKKEEA